jgi:heme exporter protein C
MKKIFPATAHLALTIIWLIVALYMIFLYAPQEATMGEVQRIFYVHFSMACTALLAYFLVFLGSMGYLWKRSRWADDFAFASAEVGFVFCCCVLVTGPLWAKPAWGIWWTWDARLTSMLLLWLLYVSYLMLRKLSSTGQTHTLAAVLSIFAAIDVPIVFMSIRWWRTQHPAPVFGGGADSGLDPSMKPAFGWNVLAWAMWGIFILVLRYALERRRQESEQDAALQAIEASLEIAK